MPNVTITVTNTGTNQASHFTTNQSGEFVAPDLPIGHYVIVAEVAGFKKSEQKDIKLDVGARTRVDIKLEIGSTQESVTVEANAVALQTESGEISDVITGQQVLQLATNGRSIYSLATLTAGASSNMVDFQNPTPVSGDNMVSFNGLRISHDLYMVDGGEDYDRGGSGSISILPSIDAIAEFRQLTSNYSAEYGLSSGTTMTMVFRSGTKDFHASGWEFFRNNALDAGNYFTNAAGEKPRSTRLSRLPASTAASSILRSTFQKQASSPLHCFQSTPVLDWLRARPSRITRFPLLCSIQTHKYSYRRVSFPGRVAELSS